MSKKRRVVEGLKNLLIAVLVCSAIWLVRESRLFRIPGILGESGYSDGAAPAQNDRAEAVLPMHMAVMTQGGCCGIQYGSEDLAAVFGRMAPLLNEALSSAGMPQPMTREEWESALSCAPGVYFDFQGAVPLQVLSGWLSGQENGGLTASARHLLLTTRDGAHVELAYRDEDSGQYFVCSAPLVSLSHLQSAAAQTQPNGAVFACQAADYARVLAPSTIISAQLPRMREYTASNPLEEGEELRLEQLLERLSFPPGITTIYETPEGRRARSGNDTLSISNDGVVTYSGTAEEQRYPVNGAEGVSPVFAAVDGASRLVRGALEPWQGEGRLYLADVELVSQDSWRVEFGYALNDTPVWTGQRGYAATVVVEQGYITRFELRLRTYAAQEQTTLLLPQRQAVAALEALGKSGSRLQLRYQDGADAVRVGWVAD